MKLQTCSDMTSETQALTYKKNTRLSKTVLYVKQNYDLYLFLAPSIIYFIIFCYVPMYGVQIAFKNFLPGSGITGGPWAGFIHFERFFNSHYFWLLIKNTLGISIYSLAAGFPAPIILALLINQVVSERFKRLVQTVTYAPYFISTVVIVGMLTIFLSLNSGIINQLIKLCGGETVFFLAKPEWFKTIYVLSGIWQGTGWGSIIYLAALSNVSVDLYQAAIVDGANKFQRIWYIDIPSIIPTAVIMLILNCGSLMSVGFEKAYLMKNSLNASSAEIISTYVYDVGLIGAQYSFSAAVGLFNSVINFILLLIVNKISKRAANISLW